MEPARPILLVEDDENDIELALAAFNEFQLANPIDIVRDGVEALDYLFRRNLFQERPDEKPAVILLDNKMPRLSGLEVLKTIKTHSKLKSIPVVMLTSSNLDHDINSSYELGANAYVVKPVDFDRFSECIKSIAIVWALERSGQKNQVSRRPS